MSFTFTGACVGPFCASIGRGKPGDIQRFRFSARAGDSSHIPYAQIVLQGRMAVSWNSDIFPDRDYDIGGSFYYDQLDGWQKDGDEMTVRAVNDSSYLCVIATGTEQRVFLDRYRLEPGEDVAAERFSLLAVAGDDSLVQINGGEAMRGPRLIYAKSRELTVKALSPSMVAIFSLRG